MKNLVILPTYNESKNIVKTINLIFDQNIDVDILVIDDNSPDNTASIVEGLKNNKIFILKRESKEILGLPSCPGTRLALALVQSGVAVPEPH